VQLLAPWVPADIVAIVHNALQIDPNARFQTAAALLDAIQPLLVDGFAFNEKMLVPLRDAERLLIAPQFEKPAAKASLLLTIDTLAPTGASPIVVPDLRRPGIVQHIKDGVTDAGAPYLAMQWQDGEDLATRLERGALDIDDTLILVKRVADALAVMHHRGIVHRDIKPSNLFLVNGQIDQVKVLDVGIVRLRDEASLIRMEILGTPSYLAPEQVRNEQAIDARVDVFALGCILMECLMGTPVFRGDNLMAALAKILLQDPPPLREIRPDLSRELDTFVLQMLSKDPKGRPMDGAAVAAALKNIRPSNLPVDTTSTDSSSRSITGDEQRILSILLVGPIITRSAHADDETELGPEVARYGCTWTSLLDGSGLVTSNAANPTAQLAHCALALSSLEPDRPIVLATGRSENKGKLLVGEVIDRAAKMVNAIAAERTDRIPVDETSAFLLDGRFDIRSIDGRFVLSGTREGGVRTLLGKPTAFVGRDVEIRLLEQLWRSCIDDSAAGAVLITGTPGMGKTRLLHEFLPIARQTAPHMDIWTGRGDSLAAGSALALLSGALRGACGLHEGMPLDERHRRIRERVVRHVTDDTSGIAGFLGEIVGAPFPAKPGSPLHAARQDARLMSEQLRRVFEEFLDAESATHPVLFVLEDLHWGDLPTVRFIDAALRNLGHRPFLVLALARPEVEERFPKLWNERSIQTLRLRPLSTKASDKLVANVLGTTANPETMARIVALAEGNAFFLEELVRKVAEAARVGKTGVTDLPETVLAMVQARLEALPAEARRYLRAASVFGESFFREGLAVLLGATADSREFDRMLDDLVVREVIQRRSQNRSTGNIEFMFRHGLIREGAYAMLTDLDRKRGHCLAGAWLEAHDEPDAMLLARHFEQGEELPRAARAYRRAADHALLTDDLHAAIERAERGVVCGASGASGEELGALRVIQAEAHNWRGELALSEQRATEAIGLLAPGTIAWFRAVQQAVDAAGKLGAFDKVDGLARPSTSAMPTADAINARTICLTVCANHLIFGGRYQAADDVLSSLADDDHFATQSAQAVGMVYQSRAIRATALGDPWGCCESLKTTLAFFEQAGDRRSACLTRQNLGFAFTELGDHESAERALRSALTVAERMGLQEVVAYTLQNLGRVLAYRGIFDEGRSIQQRAIEVFQKQEQSRGMGLSQAYLADLELLAGDISAAEPEARAAIESLSGVPALRASALAVLARILLARGRLAEGLDAAREAYGLLESLGTIEEGEGMVRLVYAEALAANGETEAFTRAIIVARDQVLTKADGIRDVAGREGFVTAIVDHARTLALASRVGL
jgi:tetratricopeptide (TPR) repeat protein